MSLEDLPEISIHLIKNNENHKFHPQTEIATHMLLAFGNVFCLSFDLGKPKKTVKAIKLRSCGVAGATRSAASSFDVWPTGS